MRKIFLFFCLTLFVCFAGIIAKAEVNNMENDDAFVSEAKMKELVQKYKKAVKTNNPEIIAEYVSYPYSRPNPIPNIDNKEEFVEQYSMLFDGELRQQIVNSSISDWDTVGWRGIMFDNGLLWLDTQGKLIAINKSSKEDKEYIAKWYEKDKASLYPSLRDYDTNVYIFETPQWKGRIDSMKTDTDDYRLALWRKADDMSDKPEVVIEDGTVDFSGTADNSDYRFTKGDYIYSFTETNSPLGEGNYRLIFYRGEKELSSSEAKIIK